MAPAEIEELRHTTDLAHHVTKQAARAIERSLAAIIEEDRLFHCTLTTLIGTRAVPCFVFPFPTCVFSADMCFRIFSPVLNTT